MAPAGTYARVHYHHPAGELLTCAATAAALPYRHAAVTHLGLQIAGLPIKQALVTAAVGSQAGVYALRCKC